MFQSSESAKVGSFTTPSPLEYRVRMPAPWTHYFEVEIAVEIAVAGNEEEDLSLVMPVWTPGSYLIREFARNVHSFAASDEVGGRLHCEKTSKNIWKIRRGPHSRVKVSYKVYAFEMSVRTSFLDDSLGYINGASVFMCPEGWEGVPIRLVIEPWPGWETIATGLDEAGQTPGVFSAPDFDTLVDCPIAIGNLGMFGFKVKDTPHYAAVHGAGNIDPARLCADLRKIVSAALEIFGDLPYRHYTFLLLLGSEGRSGLEHSNSMSLLINRWSFLPEENYKRFLELAAHEFFHVWNVKRIRPLALGPFDYTRENYTRLLWVSEGFTDYYAGIVTRRAGLASADEYLASLSKSIQDLEEAPGRLVESAAEASFDAWIKFYRQDPHSPNVTVSYYLKGSLIALVLDLEIRNRADGRSLDDVLRCLYTEYHQKRARGFTDAEFRAACESVAGGPLDEIFERYCYGTAELEYDRFLGYAGLRFAPPAEKEKRKTNSYLGVSLKTSEGRLQIVGVTAGSPAYEQGLNLNDEIIGANGFRMNQELLAARVEEAPPGTRFEFLVSRDGTLRGIPVVLGEKKSMEYRIERIPEATLLQKKLYESWLSAAWEDAPRK